MPFASGRSISSARHLLICLSLSKFAHNTGLLRGDVLCCRACLHFPLSCAATSALDTNSRMFRRHFRRCANGSKFQVLIHDCLFCPKDVRDIHISSDARSSTIQSQGFGVLSRAVRARSAASIKVDRDGVLYLGSIESQP